MEQEVSYVWLVIGFIGQAFFTMRFVVQWIASEYHKRSIIPISFWFLSIGGSAVLLAYAIHLKDPVFILGQSVGFIVYFRNLMLLRKERNGARDAGPA